MSQFDTAEAILEAARLCVSDCTVYQRQFITYGRVVVDCDTLAVSIGQSNAVAISSACTIYVTQYILTLARCCWPTLASDGSPPPAQDITEAARCFALDLENLLCCLPSIALEGEGVVGRCRPKVHSVKPGNPSGKCVSTEIIIEIQTKACCDA